MAKQTDSDSDDRDKTEEADTAGGKSYPIFVVAGMAIGASIGGALIGGTVGFVVGLVVGGGIGGALQSLVTSRRN